MLYGVKTELKRYKIQVQGGKTTSGLAGRGSYPEAAVVWGDEVTPTSPTIAMSAAEQVCEKGTRKDGEVRNVGDGESYRAVSRVAVSASTDDLNAKEGPPYRGEHSPTSANKVNIFYANAGNVTQKSNHICCMRLQKKPIS